MYRFWCTYTNTAACRIMEKYIYTESVFTYLKPLRGSSSIVADNNIINPVAVVILCQTVIVVAIVYTYIPTHDGEKPYVKY